MSPNLKLNKNIINLFIILICTFSCVLLTGCGLFSSNNSKVTTELSTLEKIEELDDIYLPAPDYSSDAKWTRIISEDDDDVIDQLEFKLNLIKYQVRAKKTTSLENVSDYKWEIGFEDTISGPEYKVDPTGIGAVYWHRDGRSFSIVIEENAKLEDLYEMYSAYKNLE